MLFGSRSKASAGVDSTPVADTFMDFGESVALHPVEQRRKKQQTQDAVQRSEQMQWAIAFVAAGLYVLIVVVMAQLHLVHARSALVVEIVAAVWAVLGGFAVLRRSQQPPRRERRSKLRWVALALGSMVAVFAFEPATQMVLTPFVFVALSYDMYRIAVRVVAALAAAVVLAVGVLVLWHYHQLHSVELLQIAGMQWLALALGLPLYVYQVAKVQRLHKVLRKAGERMKYIQADAKRDVLLDCYNRRYMVAALDAQKQWSDEHDTPLCLAVLDLDHFKRINDELGHLMGDEVLRTFAQIAQNNVRTGDIFGRYGGEEFLLVFPQTDLHDAYRTAERIRIALENFIWPNVHDLRTTVSIGVTQYMRGESVLELFSRADNAMYAAKQAGRNQVVVEETMVEVVQGALFSP